MKIQIFNSSNITRFTLIFLFALVTLSVNAQDSFTWDGSESSDWFDGDNWVEGSIPTGGANINIAPDSDHYPVIVDIFISVRNIQIGTGATLTLEAEPGLAILSVNSIFIPSDGTLINKGRIILWHDEGNPGEPAIANKGTIINSTVGNIVPESGLFTITSLLGMAIVNEGTINNAAELLITGTEGPGIQNGSPGGAGTITNSGTMAIKDVLDNGIKQWITDEPTTFTNSGTLTIDGTGLEGIFNHGIFKNTQLGEILIGQDDEMSIQTDGLRMSDTTAVFENDGGLLKIDKCISYSAISCSDVSNFINKNGGQILIGQSMTNSIGHGGIGLNNATFINNNAEIKIDNINALQAGQWGLSLGGGSDFQNLNGGQILIGIEEGSVNGPGVNCNGSTLTNDDSTIKISNTVGTGLNIGNGGTLVNLQSSTIDIGSEGLIDGVGVNMSNSSLSLEDVSTFKINNTGLAGIDMTNNCAILNNDLSKFYIGNQSPIGIDEASSNQAIRIQGTGNNIENLGCADMHLHKQVNFGSSATNTIKNYSYLFIDSDTPHEGSIGVENHGFISYLYDHIIPNTSNFESIAKPVDLEGCIINNVLDINGNDYTFEDTWYGNPQKTEIMGYYSSANNTFTMVNLPSGSPATLYYTVTGNGCSKLAKVGLIIEGYENGISTWTGTQNNNWHSNCNWSPEVVPGSSANIVIPNTSNDPIINSGVVAFGKSVLIQTSASLVINASNSLTISGTSLATNIGLENKGSLTNHGVIIVKDSESNLIQNTGNFVNSPSGVIQMYNSVNAGFTQGGGILSSFTNNGTVELYNIGTNAIKTNSGLYNNNGTIEIGFKGVNSLDNIDLDGLNMSGGSTFTNTENGSFRMKNIGNVGITNFFGTMNNEGIIEIDDTAFSGIWNAGNFDNDGNLKIGMNGASGNITEYGILQTFIPNFKNLENGIIQIDNTGFQTIGHFGGSFENSGLVFSHGQILIDESETLTLKSGRFEILND